MGIKNIRSFWSVLLAAVLIGGAVLSAQSVNAATEPIRGQRGEMKSLSMVKMVLKAGYSSDVRIVSDQLLAALAKDIKDYGYNVVGASDEGVFNANDPNKAEMQLAGTINHLECEDNRNYRFVSNCDIAVAWELYDTAKEKVVYTVLTRFRREVEIEDRYIEEEVKRLLSGAIRSLLMRERFVAYLKTTSDAEATAAPDAAPEKDADDPTFASLSIEPTEVEKTWRISLRDRHFYSGWRYPLIIGGPLLFATGGTLLLVSRKKFEDAERDYDIGDNQIPESKWNKIKLLNTLGWALGGVGLGATVLFFVTPRSREKIQAEKEAAMAKQAHRLRDPEPVRLSVSVTGNGLLLQGSF